MTPDPILLVDDEADLRMNLKEALIQDGYQVEEAADAVTALALMETRHYPVVLTDLNMPGGPTGFELIQAVKAHDPLALCVVITGYASMQTAIQAVKYGAYDFVQKPFKLAEIEAVLDRALDHSAVLRQLMNYQNDLEDRVLARMRELNEFHDEVLHLNDLLIASQTELSEGPLLEPFLHHLRTRFAPRTCLALLPGAGDDWTLPPEAWTAPAAHPLPAPSALRSHQEWPWLEGCPEGFLIPLRSGELVLGALLLGFTAGTGFQPEGRSFVLWRRQVEAALHGLFRTREQLGAERTRALRPGPA